MSASMPVKSRAAARTQAQRDRILDAARKCFSERGFQGASIASIAQTAGISQGLIYRYFTNKAAIVHSIVEEQRASRGDALAGVASGQDLVDMVMAKLESWRGRQGAFDREFDPILFLEITAEATRDPDVAAVLSIHEQSIWSDLAKVISRGAHSTGTALDASEVQQRTMALRCLIDGMILNWVRDPQIDPALLRRSLNAVCASLVS